MLRSSEEFRSLTKTRSKRQQKKLVKRLLSYGSHNQEIKEGLTKQKSDRIIAQCSFRPNTRRDKQGTKPMKRKRSFSNFLKDQKEFMKKKFENKAELEQDIKEKKKLELTHKPKLSKVSERIMKSVNRKKKVYERLYQSTQRDLATYKKQIQEYFVDQYSQPTAETLRDPENSKSVQVILPVKSRKPARRRRSSTFWKAEDIKKKEAIKSTFIPQIDKRSKKLKRKEPVEVILYKDA